MDALATVASWPVPYAAVAVLSGGEVVATRGDLDRPYELASLTKLLTAMAILIAHEEETLDLDDPATAAGATVADLLAHASGAGPSAGADLAPPRSRRIYSSHGYDIAAVALTRQAEMSFADYVRLAVLEPLGMTPRQLEGSAGAGAIGSLDDMIRLASAWRAAVLVHPSTLERARTPHLPELGGVLPGYGRHDPNLWGLGPEIRGRKTPHWTGSTNSPATFGHFGQSGTMMWIDPVVDVVLIALTDRPFGDWAVAEWPTVSDAVLAEVAPTAPI